MSAMLVDALAVVFQPVNVVVAVLGIMLGTILGAIPGLTATMGIALLLPITYYMDPITAIILLTAMYKGGLFGGSITAILFSVPGTPAAAFTTIDGYQMTKKGQAGKALKVSLVASVTGDVFANIVLIFCAGILASWALAFGAPEYAALIVFSLAAIVALSRGNLAKDVLAMALGILCGMVGFDSVAAQPRFSFDSPHLAGGLEIVPVLIGLLAVSEIFLHIEKLARNAGVRNTSEEIRFKRQDLGLSEIWGLRGVLLRSAAIGTWIGTLPGPGPGLAGFLGYQNARTMGKNHEKVGTGVPEGVAAPEAANSAVGSANLIPLLSLGIPGDAEAAMILSVMVLHGITPGPLLFEQNGSIVYAIMFGILMAALLSLVINWYMTKYIARVSRISFQFVMPVVLITAIAGSYGVNQSMFDVYVMVAFAVLGYFMHKFGFSTIAMLVGFILGPMLESSLRTALIMSDGSFYVFITRPLSAAFLSAAALIVLWNIWAGLRDLHAGRVREAVND